MSFFSLQTRIIRQPQCTKLLRYKGSDGWFSKRITPKRCLRAMPFITKEGYVSSNTVYYTRCTSSVWFSSVVSTVYDRIISRRARWSRGAKRMPKDSDLCLKIALISVLNSDDRLLTRLVECSKRNDKAAKKMVYAISRNMDATKRFWYDQALKGASWLKRRGGNPRDKSMNQNDDNRLVEVDLDPPREGECQRFIDSLAAHWTAKELVSNASFRLISLVNRKKARVPLNAKPRKRFGVKAYSRLRTTRRR